MGPYDAVPAPPRTLHPCPSCGLTDQVRSVPAVYHAGRSRTTARYPQGNDHYQSREVVSDLARALAPAPIRDQPPGRTAVAMGVAALLVAGFTFIAGTVARQFNDDHGDTAVVGSHSAFEVPVELPVVAVVVAAALFLAAALLSASAGRELAGRPRAEQLWARAWYCARCGTVHFPPAAGPSTAALSLPEFRRMVWHAGGYGHLADRY
ncbi:hypothetical protein [Streptomyces sp. NRRL S-350]|uniref:hypothetical protein n=1 Tax=Streptomyces sp. NRRL S-350 TaxID=1463902 RepID=UPI0004C25528|nr:hypothetical protein [Streptomyces sp. NRRL S-350]